MNNSVKKILPFSILILSLGLIYFILRDHIDELSKVTDISLVSFALISALVLFFIIMQGLRNKWILELFGISLSVREWFGLSVINTFWNYLPFQGGMVAKGVYLKQRYKFAYPDYLAVISTSYIITFIVLGIIGVFSVFAIYIKNGSFSLIVFGFYIILVFMTVCMIFMIRKRIMIRWLKTIMDRMYNGILLVFKNKRIVIKLVLLDITIAALFASRLAVASAGIGFDIPLTFFILVTPVALLSVFTSLTPGGLVVREALIGFFAVLLTVDVTNSIIVTVLDRGISLVWIFSLGIIFNVVLSRIILKSRNNARDDEESV